MSRIARSMVFVVVVSVLCPAQPIAPPKAFSGAVVSFNDEQITLKGLDGGEFVVHTTPGWTLSVNHTANADSIKPNDFVATSNTPVDDNTGRSTELRILEPGYRPEFGSHPVSQTNPNIMTHGTVQSVRKSDQGVELDVTYPGGSRHILVPQTITVTVSVLLPRESLQPGTKVSGVTRVNKEGVACASRIQPSNP